VKPRALRDLGHLVDRLEEMVDTAREIPLTDGIRMDRSDLEDVVRQMRAAIGELDGSEIPAPERYGGDDLFAAGPSIWDET
jgi:hypothetical protein